MKRLRALLVRLAGMFGDGRRERELAEELDSHLQLHIDDNLRAGMSPEEARRAAVLKLGGVEQAKQAYRERATLPVMENALRDLQFALRQLRKNPGFAVTAVLMLALGLGASVAIFAFVDAALIKPLPYPNPGSLVDVTESIAIFHHANLSYPDYLDWKRLSKSFTSFDIYQGTGYLFNAPSGTEPVAGERVSDGFFHTLGVAPMLGRDFYQGEDLPSAPHTVILSYRTWQKRFDGRKDVIGQSVSLSGIPYTIVGVMPQSFQFALRNNAEFWTAFHASGSCDLQRHCHGLIGVARLKDGVSVQAALADVTAIAQQLERQYPNDNRGQGATVQPFSELIVGDIRPILLTLLGGAALLLLIACVNVSSLLLVRSESRKKEIAVRGALGASSARMARQFVTEGVVLVAISALLGLSLAFGVSKILVRLIPEELKVSNMPYLDGLGPNVHVLCFAAAISLFAVALFSLTPILRLAFREMREGLSEGSRGSAGVLWRRIGANLVVLELAIAVVLLVGAGLLGKSFYRLLRVETNFEPDHLATLQVMIPEATYAKDEQVYAVRKEIVRRIAAIPGVTSIGTTTVIPVSGNGNTDWIRFVGREYNGKHNEVNFRVVSPNYFRTLKTNLIRGRFFTEGDDATKPTVAIINQSLARQYFPNEDPIGKRIGDTSLSPDSIKEIVGVVDDLREASLDGEIMPAAYYAANQSADTFFNLVVRTKLDEKSLLPTLVSTIHQVDPSIGTIGEATMLQRINDSPTSYLHRSSAWLVGGFAAVALVLSVVGLYGVIAYSVSQRTREIGVRMALGAQRGSVYRMILREAGWLIAVGVVVGLGCSLAAGTLMRTLLFGVRAWDVPTLAGVACVLGASALMASYVPARRAASVNPVDALRAE